MAISFVTSGEAGAINGGDPAITLGATPAANDLILVACGIGDNDSVDFAMAMVTAGYTLVPSSEIFADSGTTECNFAVFYKFANGSENTLTFDGQGGVDAACAAVAMVFRGVDTTTPFDVTSTTSTNLTGYTPDPPSIDWTTAGVAVVSAVGSSHQIGVAGTLTAPANYTTNARDANAEDTTSVTVAMGYNLSPSDPENPATWTHNGTDAAGYAGVAVTMALRPAAEAGPATYSGWYGTSAGW